MRKVPSYLKGLVETRARVSADVIRNTRLKSEIEHKLAEAVAETERLRQLLGRVSTRLDVAESELKSCDCLIIKFNDKLDPASIKPIRAHHGRYGKRGQLKQSTLEFLRQYSPAELTTTEIGWLLIEKLELDFVAESARRKWIHNSVCSTLKALVREGLAERTFDPASLVPGEDGRWRASQTDGVSATDLQELAVNAGIATAQARGRGRPRKEKID